MKKILSAVALAAACGVASAQGYAGALIGMSQYSGDCPSSCDKSDSGFKIYGGYQVTNDIAVELGYTDFGTVKIDAGGKADISAVSVVAAYRYAFSQELTGVGRLGLGFAKVDGSEGIEDDDAVNLYAGLGLEYAVANGFKIVGAFDLADNGDVYLFGIGAQMGF